MKNFEFTAKLIDLEVICIQVRAANIRRLVNRNDFETLQRLIQLQVDVNKLINDVIGPDKLTLYVAS